MSHFSQGAKDAAYRLRHMVPTLRYPVRHRDTHPGVRELADASHQFSRVLETLANKLNDGLDAPLLTPKAREQLVDLAVATRKAAAKQSQARQRLDELCQLYQQALDSGAIDKTHRIDGKE